MNATPTVTQTLSTLQPIIVRVPEPHASLTDYIAWAGFILSLFLGGFDVYKYWNNRGKLTISFGFDIPIIARTTNGKMVRIEPSKNFWSIVMRNSGSKSINISQMSLQHKGNEKNNTVITKDYDGNEPYFTLEPDKSHSLTFSYDVLNPSKFSTVHLMDQVGKVYKQKLNYKG